MRILVVSDTHGKDTNFFEVLEKEKNIDKIIHCGDSEDLGYYLKELTAAELIIVEGNCDIMSPYPYNEIVDIPGHRIFITHGHRYSVKYDLRVLAAEAEKNGADIAIFGHTHVPTNEFVNGIHVFNPGSLSLPRQASRKHTYGIIEVSEGKFDMSLYSLD